MDPAVPWQYTYNRLAAQGATSGDLHHHFAQAANNSALTGGHASSVSAVPSTTSQLLLQAAHSTPLGASTASFPTPSSFLSAPSYDVFSPLFHHANPKPAHFNTINAAAQHRQQVLAAQAAVTKQTTDSDIIRENYTQHHSSISTPQTGSYFEQPGGSAVAAALGWQARGGQSDFTTLRSQGDLNSNNQLPSAFGILPHENVSSSPAPSTAAAATKHSSSSGSSTGVYESFNAHFPQPLNQANAIIKSSSTARSMSPQQQQQQSQQQIKQQNIASTSASSGYYQTPSTYQNLQSSFANSKSISQQEQLQHQQAQQHSYSNNSNQQAISGSKSSFSVSSTGISSSSQLNSSSDPSTSSISKEYSNSSHHISSRVKSERSNSPVIASNNFASSAALHKLTNSSVNQVQTKAALKAIVQNSSIGATQSLNHNHIVHGHGHGQGQASAIHENNVIQSSPISFSMLENQVAYSGSNNNHNINSHSASRNASSVRKLSTTPLLKQEFQHDSASTISPSASANSITNSHPTDCSHIVIPRRPSPHQINSQSSPLSTVPSPAYPMYNSPSMNPSQSPIDASTSRTSSKSNCSNVVAYSSVIQRAAHPSNWDGGGGGGGVDDRNQSSLQNNANQIYTPAQITKLHQISPVHSVHSQQSSHFDSSQSAQSHQNQSNLAAQKINDSAQQMHEQTDYALNQRSRQPRQTSSISNDKNKQNDGPKARPGRKKKINDRADSCEKLPSPSTCSEYYVNERIPPPAHIPNQQSMNGSTTCSFNNIHSHNSTMISHPSHHHAISHHPYFPSFSMPLTGIGDYSNDLNLNSIPMVANIPYNDSLGTPSVSSNYSPTASEIREDEPPKVVVPNIEEELGFLAENSRSGSIQQASAQMSLQASSTAAAATQNHLTLLGTTSNSLSHHNQSNQQHLQHHSHANNQNTNQSQSSSSNPMNQQKATPLTDKKFPTPTGPGSGFMASYLKFLQGERDTSPPPMNRGSGGGRKTWSRATTNQPVTNQSPAAGNNAQAKNQMSNGMNVHNNMMGGSIYDRKRSADDDDDASDSSNNKPVTNRNSKKQSQQPVIDRAPQVPINAAKKARTTQSSHNNSLLSSQQTSNHALSLQQNNPHSLQQNPQLLMQQHATPAHQLVAGTSQILSQQQMYYPQDNEDPLTVPQRRETSHRKAKGRSIQNALQKQTLGSDNQNDDLDEPPEFVDSDSDPAWTPNKEDDDDDDMPRRKNTRKTRNSNARSNTKRGTVKSNTYAGTTNASNIEYSNSNSSGAQQNYGTSNNPDEFQTGDFIVSRQDAFLDWPAIWRVDSTTLLQKFEPFHSNNKTIYRSLSTYAQWSPESCRSYISVKCIHIGQLQHEMHVELQRSELCAATSEMYIEKVMQEAFTSLQDQFEVYIQALISQALDSNFLTEIHQEQDEYFLSNVKTIDDLTSGRKMRLRNTMAWPTRILHSIEIWPCYNVINDLGVTNNGQIICVACNKRNIVSRVVLYGQPYNQNTIGPTQLDGRYSFDKDLLLCRSLCVVRCELLHKISHQKYLMFMQCSKKVAELNQQDPTKGTTVILNELLADEAWLSELFGLVRRAWAEVDQIERLHRVLS
ncbi:mucin-19-like isoform X2 [Sitodiplosis mosellana]|uniref:mucin-19-like isoform X2 n=1 Tax=Sitodiplosis mosellana TaxID=263140 RepID=UPI0024441CEA|nr:mucin-19-like isoform X2 [Sitodiplosis mosellana]XP_055310291.1 mucin-19-like isoform X2 [Sitodiplosis mosellana]XP_055310292.1 mucin-19-like isoform X2 [Sitodiplosis mosellana]XP_055310293.1 mucin-19-like isoform X2 [Sitodiplosis mosellana]XP_055310294.1 mucin-19-like isoform X2 [Sitodiplosis mosellana]XP_055310295.1 mucin-19-like isoform X2 [Sitodiplosis mosellana]XP_055310296.1 mucin-19-like isoform X2 [Sitodiplosis mosellana]XP_055310297.1 mucin-19-like isoform X2 [Sitodiplosis mosell